MLDGFRIRALIRKYSDHIAIPIRMEKTRLGRGQEGIQAHRRGRDRQPGERAVGAAEIRGQRRAVPGILQACGARFRAAARLDPQQGRGPARVHAAPVSAGACALRSVGPDAPPRHQAVRAPGIHHGRCRATAPRLPQVRARGGRFERPAAQRVARNPAAEQGHRGDPLRLHQAHTFAAGRPGAKPEREIREFLEGVRPGAEGRRGRGPCQQGEDCRAAALCEHACGQRGAERIVCRLSGAHEAGTGKDLLRHRRLLPRREEQPASGSVPQEGHRGSAAGGARGRMAGVESHRIRRQAARLGGAGAIWTWASSRTRRRRRSRKNRPANTRISPTRSRARWASR